ILVEHISVSKDMSQLSCSSFKFTSRLFSMVLVFQPARVTAHNTPTAHFPSRTTVLIKCRDS
ncbi:hypothetical protein GGX14DRAFT_329065, partial [Mycena pura]